MAIPLLFTQWKLKKIKGLYSHSNKEHHWQRDCDRLWSTTRNSRESRREGRFRGVDDIIKKIIHFGDCIIWLNLAINPVSTLLKLDWKPSYVVSQIRRYIQKNRTETCGTSNKAFAASSWHIPEIYNILDLFKETAAEKSLLDGKPREIQICTGRTFCAWLCGLPNALERR